VRIQRQETQPSNGKERPTRDAHDDVRYMYKGRRNEHKCLAF
jgi:hypothetical protein